MKWKNIDIGAGDHLPRDQCRPDQVRALAIYSEKKLHAMVNYIHANPVRKKLVKDPGEWEHSSWGFYEQGEKAVLEIEPPVL